MKTGLSPLYDIEMLIKFCGFLEFCVFLDCRQHGFLNFKSCTTNMVNFTDKLVMSINDTQTLSTDVIYFDFAKAFDFVNHDLILHKLKYAYAIDRSLLKFLMNYLLTKALM